ncbi:putative E3 ubiquitin-protein ligase LOG2 [Camellia lanceoleosa]|uniref:E3 ubiquitin-protein ligase LOG2 n=1 Tax=Camellia lanceoleosa TaxID=1840588 RepID=A0ACC0IZ34_9ERIC|nr:putative E3 ubiquitin-protein ligase LOG2 [Camellia lanceoleosa]
MTHAIGVVRDQCIKIQTQQSLKKSDYGFCSKIDTPLSYLNDPPEYRKSRSTFKNSRNTQKWKQAGQSRSRTFNQRPSQSNTASSKPSGPSQPNESEDCSLTTTRENLIKPVTMHFEQDLGQKFIQPSRTGIDFSMFDERELLAEGDMEVYPLVVKAEASPVR